MAVNCDRPYWVAWSQIKRIGSVLMRRLHEQFGSLEAAWSESEAGLLTVEGIGPQLAADILRQRSHLDPEQLYAKHLQANPQFWTLCDREYPRLLQEIHAPPPLLYYRGIPDAEEMEGNAPTIAIVGTRRPSPYGLNWTRRLTRRLSQEGFTIISGLAAGIDTEAHRTCLTLAGRTVAVVGTGVDVVYPRRNQSLYEEIVEKGLVVSEYPAGTPPDRLQFPQRNRIIAGLSRATLVTEAPQKSGALITAYLANEFCRDVYAVPGSLDNPNSRGCLGLISRGAQLVMDEDNLIQTLQEMPSFTVPSPRLRPEPLTQKESSVNPSPKPAATPTVNVPPHLAQVFAAVAPEATAFDIIVEKSATEAAAVSSALLQLELMGFISALPGLRYQRN
ncbi:DNA-protecting protein DprA [Geitlerinema sp. P-1104]|uniref:DNA-processing protein DprA n=1 Tax=Geitlerinema sp. P-1104 TaxID=2546230 RepID=UPI001476F100|nr:DNA-processing protein DprA [Geitlerinema sp. P-1104]NMG60229.1 DNA-protecting protein DprA [Geitlerinema sp. P-1104]